MSRASSHHGNVVHFPAQASLIREYNGPVMHPEPESAQSSLGRHCLGEWVVIPAENRLISGQESHRIEPRTMDVLMCLAERAGSVVSKNSLIDQVWDGNIISEGTLTNSIAELRAALGDDARNPRYIETIPKRGYRLIVQVEVEEDREREETSDMRRHPGRWLWAAAGLVGVVAAGTAFFSLRPAPVVLDPGKVLVVPLVNRTGEPDLDAFGLLAADRIVAELSASGFAEPVSVGPKSAALDVDGLSEAARDQGCALAMAGAFYLHEGDIELLVQLIDVAEGAILYAAPSEITPRNDAQEALDRAIQRALGAVVTHLYRHAHNQLQSQPPLFEAYKEFIAGSVLWGVDFEATVAHLERAVEIDPEFVSASLRLAMAYQVLGRRLEATAIVGQLKERSQTLTVFERLWVDLFAAWFDGRIVERLRLIREIEAVVPDDVVVRYLHAESALALNRPQEALDATENQISEETPGWLLRVPWAAGFFVARAAAYHRIGDHENELRVVRDGQQYFPMNRNLRMAEVRALAATGAAAEIEVAVLAIETVAVPGTGPPDLLVEAAASARAHDHLTLARDLAARALDEIDSDADSQLNPRARWIEARALIYSGDLEEAQRILQNIRSQASEFAAETVMGWLGMVAARRGDLETVATLEAELAAMDAAAVDGATTYNRAAIAVWLGHREDALSLLRKARHEGWGDFNLLHDRDRELFMPLQGMPEFEALIHPVD